MQIKRGGGAARNAGRLSRGEGRRKGKGEEGEAHHNDEKEGRQKERRLLFPKKSRTKLDSTEQTQMQIEDQNHLSIKKLESGL